MAEYVQILDSWNRKLRNNGRRVVSDAQVLSALGLALMMVTTVEARSVQMIRIEPIMLLAE